MVDINLIGAYAKTLPAVTEEPHHEMNSFRVKGKIFVTVPSDVYLHVFVDEMARESALVMYPHFIEKLMWGSKVAGIRVALAKAEMAVVKQLVRAAWESKAPKSLLKSTP